MSLDLSDAIAVLRLPDAVSVAQAVLSAREAITHARESGRRGLMVVATSLAGTPPSLPARHEMIRGWAEAGQGKVAFALVVPAAFIDPEKFGVVSARNFGLRGDAFSDEGEAAEWLRLHL